jgi:fatty acid desaturase
MRSSDYRLVGGAGETARARGLVEAEWYRSAIPRAERKALFARDDGPALRDTALWYGLIVLAALAMIALWETDWAVVAFLVYGTLYAGPADSRWHESGHGTAFATDWMNNCLYQMASFQVMRRPTVWKWSHARHHTDTLITGRDREIQVRLPIRPAAVLLDFFGFALAPREFVAAFLNASGRIRDEERTFIPESEAAKVVREARIWVAIFLAVAAAALYFQSWLPIALIGLLPSICGSWLYNFFGIVQHACLPENVLDHRLNSRTVLINRVFRFLYWNMNYHVEHHMYPAVPYHALPRLHEAIKADCPVAYPSMWAAYREFLPALVRQWRDPSYVIRRPLPSAGRA